ncbi:type II secretion system F family protein [Natrialbaceae archaeon GCM10025810]|uniref:type II secretion system F family protein n=1 Tax=Halovalidus salilacus TaxID=3075124 RepID=UPI003614F1ED
MTLATTAPLALAIAICLPALVARYHDGTDRALARAAVRLFGRAVHEFRSEHPGRRAALRSAQFPTTYREYASTTLLHATVAALAGSVVGIYAIWAVLRALAIDRETMREALPESLAFLANLGGVPALSAVELFALFAVSSFTLGALAGGGTYWLRWWYPRYVADARARRIEATLPAAVAFVHALSKSGMAFPEIVRIAAEQEATYGEVANEFAVAVRNVDTFGMDVISALQVMGRRSPSVQFREFTENLVSVLQSGHSLSAFLERQYRDYQEESETQQERMLALLATLAEAYVTVLVAGPLFLITVLVVIGISVGDTHRPLQALIYLVLPLGNVAFIVYLSVITDGIDPGRAVDREVDVSRPALGAPPLADGGVAYDRENLERARYYELVRGLRSRFGHPIRTLRDRPALTLAITIPIALLAIARSLPDAVAGDSFDATAIDGVVSLSILFVLVVFAGFYGLHRRRIEAIEASIPDLLDRLASVNEAGTSIVSAIDHVRRSDLGPLGAELDRVWHDVQWGADLQTALYRFEGRVRTRATARVVTLVTEAMNASGNLSTVLGIASRQAAADRRLKRDRKQAMVEYTIVVYVSFLVFLFIIAVLAAYLLPNLPTEGLEAGSGGGLEGFGDVSAADMAAYSTLFEHATLVQGLLSGLIAGQLSTGDVRAGAKHAAAMIALSHLLFAFVV